MSSRHEQEQLHSEQHRARMLTTRARPPFQPGHGSPSCPGESASLHSGAPSHSASLQANSGFQTELGVSSQLLVEFVLRTQEEQRHFYSPGLFWEYKLAEMLRATEPDPRPQLQSHRCRLPAAPLP